MKSLITVIVLAATAVGTAAEVIYNDGPTMGISVLPAERNQWKAHSVRPAAMPTADDYKGMNLDFFQAEYGKAESFDFAVGENGRFSKLYGAAAFDDAADAIRVCRGWGKFSENHCRLEMDVEQDVPETDWEIVFHRREWRSPTSFKVKNGANVVKFGVISTLYIDVFGIELACRTKGAHGKVRRVRLVPEELPVAWRNTFALRDKPVKAGISYVEKPNYTLTVNGTKVREGSRILFKRVRKIDLAPYLKVGENKIEFVGNWGGGYDGGCDLSAEIFAVDATGRVTYGDDANWVCRIADGKWQKCVAGGRIGIDILPNGHAVADGSLPMHAGPLTVAPKNPDGSIYPVFDYDGPIVWQATFPSELGACDIVATVNGRTYSAHNGVVDFAGLKTGAYDVTWRLNKDGQTIDETRSEMVVAGPLEDILEVPYCDFDATLAKRKRLVQTVDCRKVETNPTNFVDHTGPYAAPETGVSRVVTEGDIAFRETGGGNGDFFGYKLKTGGRGKAHIVEVDVPDVREQILYIAVNESMPVPFCNNGFPLGSRGWPNATGAAKCGGMMPLSGKVKTVSVVFFPGTENATIAFENGIPGKPAGVVGFRVYEVPDGLPALKIPPTDRLYANHNERPAFQNWGAHVNPKIQECGRDLFEGCWKAAYAGIANRISFLKFAGHNAAVEGAYMYKEFFPTESGESDSCCEEWDYYYAMAKMYRHNRIRLLTCFEYMRSPVLTLSGALDVSDADVCSGRKRSAYCIDRHGRIVTGCMGSGLNFLNPTVRDSVKRVVREVYERYAKTRAVEALWMVNGYWWMPGIPMLQRQTARDVSYDDDSIEQFQKDTGINLGLPWTGRGRFAKRHEVLNGKYEKEWYGWRARKLREALEEIRSIIASGSQPWALYSMPVGQYPSDHPFCRSDASAAERDAFLDAELRNRGFDPDLFGKGTDAKVALVPDALFERMLTPDNYGILVNRGSRELYRRNDALYFHPVGLNERPCRCPKATAWWWRDNGIAVYDVKQVGENAFSDLVEILDEYAPKRLFHSWIDVNVPSAFTDEARRFLTGFYATPCGDPERFPAITGVTANRYGSSVQLVNATPYAVSGRIVAQKSATDALTGRTFKGETEYTLAPYGVTVVKTDNPERTLSGAFAFDGVTSALVRRQGWTLIRNQAVADKLTDAQRKAISDALERGDDYAAERQMRDWEIYSVARRFFDSTECLKNQNRLLSMLKREGCARIDCGNLADFTDERGRLWLRDQPYTGFGAYGNEFGVHVDRGPIAIANTDIPGIYRTESGSSKSLYYHLPLPKGTYRVILHFAETWDEAPGRIIDASVGGVTKKVHPWQLGGGRCAAAVVTFDDICPTKGIVTVKLVDGSPIINGIEVIRVSKTASAAPDEKPMEAKTLVDWHGETHPIVIGLDGHRRIDCAIPKYVPASNEISLSLLVRATGTRGNLMFSFDGVRLDLGVDNGKIRPAIVGLPPGRGFFAFDLPEHRHLGEGWHHVVYVVNPAGEASVWVDGEKCLSGDFVAKLGAAKLPKRGHGDLQIDLYPNANHTKDCRFEIKRAVLREGLMTIPEIQAEFAAVRTSGK